MTEKHEGNTASNKGVHPPVVALIYIVIATVFGRLVPLPLQIPVLVQNIGFGLMFIGFLFGIGALLEVRKARSRDTDGAAMTLVTTGIYRFTRNPIYLGFLLMVIGFPLNYGFYWGVIVAPLFVATMNLLVIRKEEAYLEKKFKEQYAGYRSRVRRWI